MKIRRSVKSDININVGADNAKMTGSMPPHGHERESHHEGFEIGDRSAACDFIQKAIDELSKIAESDEVARDSIANLGVVLLDLKS